MDEPSRVECPGLVERTTRPSNRVQPGPGPELLARLLAGGLGEGLLFNDRPPRRQNEGRRAEAISNAAGGSTSARPCL